MKPLEGLRIIDLTVAVAGPVATQYLGDLGAEVIRVEPPFARPIGHLDVSPAIDGAPDRPYNRVVGYNDLQRSKRGVTLDLSQESGRDALLRLIAHADAVVENMSPRVLGQLRLTYDDLRGVKPDIVLVSMPAFGLSGPLRERVSYGPGIDAMSGLSWLTGYPDRGPMNAALYYCDYNAGALAAFATLVALRHRDRTGEGQHLELAMLEGELQNVADALMDFAMNGRVQQRMGNAHPTMSPHGAYPCAGDDRWLTIACEDDAQWRALCGVMQRPDLLADPRYIDVVSRVRRRSEVDNIVAAWTSTVDAFAAAEALQAAGVAAAAVQNVSDVLRDDQLAHRRWLQRVRHPEAGEILHARPAFTLSGTPYALNRAAPLFGQDNDDVLRGLAGLTGTEMRALREAGTVRDTPPEPQRRALDVET